MNKLRIIIIIILINLTFSCSSKDKKEKPKIPLTKINHITIINPAIKLSMDKVRYDQRIPKDIHTDFLGFVDEDNIVVRKRAALGENSEEFWILKPYEEKIYKKFHIERGSRESPSGITSPATLANFNDLICIWDMFGKIMVFDNDFNWQLTQMVTNPIGDADFYKIGNKYFYLLYNPTYDNKTVTIALDTYSFNPFRQTKKPRKLNTIYSCKKQYFRNIKIKNKRPLKGIWSEIYAFEQGGKIFYSDNKTRILNIYDTKTNETRRIEFAYLKGRIFDEDELTMNNFFLKFQTERLKNIFNQKYKLMYYKEPLYHFGMVNGGDGYIGIFSNIDIKNWKICLDLFKLHDGGSYYKSIEISIPDQILYIPASNNTSLLLRILLNVKRGFICYTSYNSDTLNLTSTIMYF